MAKKFIIKPTKVKLPKPEIDFEDWITELELHRNAPPDVVPSGWATIQQLVDILTMNRHTVAEVLKKK